MVNIELGGAVFYTERESVQVQWRGDALQNRAIGRSWTCKVVCETSGERETLFILAGQGSFTVKMPDGEIILKAVVTITEDSWMHYPLLIGIRIEEVL